METRVITHDENHYDIEAIFPVRDDSGLWVDVWAVIYCNENEKWYKHRKPNAPRATPADVFRIYRQLWKRRQPNTWRKK